MAILGGSPLGLIGVMSSPVAGTFMSTFNGGRSRNINVNLYNVGKETDKEKLSKFGAKGGMFSLFTGGNILNPWANISTTGTDKKDLGVGKDDMKGVSRKTLHNNDIYDTSILNIIEKTANTRAQLRPSDFAYLKNLGVYPNNRLVIARRFAGPVDDNIFTKAKTGSGGPDAVMITWRIPSEDFLEISFGEEWEEAKADFTGVLNDMGEDIFGKKIAGGLSGVAGAIPLPGFTEAITRNVLAELGIYDGAAVSGKILPAGNPNLIKQAKRRKTVKYGDAGSGLKCTCSVKMMVEWEQKFISGIDPTIAFIDILATCLRFGTSPSDSYGLSESFGAKIVAWSSNPGLIVTDFLAALTSSLTKAKDEIVKLVFDENVAGYNTKKDKDGNPIDPPAPLSAEVGTAIDGLIAEVTNGLKQTVKKYKHEIMGIVASLTGAPSTPWHVTIGNPLRPVFCSGDMLTDMVTLKLGSTLAFNDLPSNITLDFSLTNARPWGLQEIMAKFNTGNLRVVNPQKDFTSLAANETTGQNKSEYSSGTSGTSGIGTSGTGGGGGVKATVDNKVDPSSGASTTTTKEGQDSKTINSDPNSSQPPVSGETKTESSTGSSGISGTSGTSALTTDGGLVLIEDLKLGNSNTSTPVDPVGDANATTTRGYTYEVISRTDSEGTVTSIKVRDKDGVVVTNFYDTDLSSVQPPNIPALINAAKQIVNDK